MKLQKKIYRCKTHYLNTIIRVKGREVRITFENGGFYNGTETSGTYSTINPDIQAAIESDPRFGKTITLHNAIDIGKIPDKIYIPWLAGKNDTPPITTSVIINFSNDENENDGSEAETEADEIPTTDTTSSQATPMTNIADLKQILSGIPYKIPLSRLNNKTKILAEATQAGVPFEIE